MNRVGIARLNANGSLDKTFDARGDINAMGLQPNGKVLVAGSLNSGSYGSPGLMAMAVSTAVSVRACRIRLTLNRWSRNRTEKCLSRANSPASTARTETG